MSSLLEKGEMDSIETESSVTTSLLDAVAEPVLLLRDDESIAHANPAAADLFGYSRADLVSMDFSGLIGLPSGLSKTRFLRQPSDGNRHEESNSPLRMQHRDGSTHVIEIKLRKCRLNDRKVLVAAIRDLTQQQDRELEMNKHIRDLESAMAQSETQSERIVELVETLAAEKDKLKAQEHQLRENERELQRYLRDLEMTRILYEEQASELVELAEALHSEKKIVEESRRVIEHQSLHDPLTELGNRALLNKVLPEMIEQARANGTKVGLIYIDLDNFKPVNDRLGHEAGDDLLKQVAVAMRGCVRQDDAVVRQGGDEFAVAVRLTATRTEAHLWELAERIRDSLTIAVDG